MNFIRKVLIIFCIVYIHQVTCFFDPLTLSAAGVAAGVYFGYNKIKCSYQECCNDEYIPKKITGLNNALERKLFGQDIAKSVITSALRAHTYSSNNPKALSMSFHGLAGTGKNHVARMIVDNFFKNGFSSKYAHFFNGRSDFPSNHRLDEYKEHLQKIIVDSLQECEQSLFVFDEVDMMTPGVLNVLVPFLDYGPAHIWHRGTRARVETKKAIFIFLSNTGSQSIVEVLLDLWKKGRSREQTRMSDFETLIAIGAFNEKGGFERSDTISTNLIDHYVPFLPLEAEHVKLCIEAAFRERGKIGSADEIQEVMEHVTFGPEPHNLYAKSGCKRVEQKVASLIYQRRFRDN